MIDNPYWRSPLGINAYSTRNILTAKTWVLPGNGNNGFFWINGVNAAAATTLTPGDIYLVCRIDGNTLADAEAIVTRAQHVAFPMATATILLDSDGSNIDGTGKARRSLTPAPTTPSRAHRPPRRRAIPHREHHLGHRRRLHRLLRRPEHFLRLRQQRPAARAQACGPAPHGLVRLEPLGREQQRLERRHHLRPVLQLPPRRDLQHHRVVQRPLLRRHRRQPVRPADAGRRRPLRPGRLHVRHRQRLGAALPISVADNEQIAKNFLLGNLTWAEAAYTSLPALSWQQIVLGDPLARPRRDREDISASGAVTIDDLYAWQQTPVDLNNSGQRRTTRTSGSSNPPSGPSSSSE